MPQVVNDGTRIHYEVSGSGEPVVLIMGLGWDMSGWDSMLPYLSDYRVLRIDNRGAGSSDAPDAPYTIPLMARDVLAAMDDASIDRAHVYGASLGSMIAQEIALSDPDRVRSLILGCPSPGFISVPGSFGILLLMRQRERLTQEQALRRGAKFLVHRAESVEKLWERYQQSGRPNPVGYRRQLRAVFWWSSLSRLPRLKIPTLIVHGRNDRLIPIANGRLIARLIPDSTMIEIPECGHVYSIDAPGVAAEAVMNFLQIMRVA
ncbi:MAG: alpha/beta fold hydrolase [Actinomycetota bacterium]